MQQPVNGGWRYGIPLATEYRCTRQPVDECIIQMRVGATGTEGRGKKTKPLLPIKVKGGLKKG
jgi:hypothetical protein